MLDDFDPAATFVKNCPDSILNLREDRTKLKFYKYYMQATEGDCNVPRPTDVKDGSVEKWEAWKSAAGTKKEEAKLQYIKLLEETLPTWKLEAEKQGIKFKSAVKDSAGAVKDKAEAVKEKMPSVEGMMNKAGSSEKKP